VNALITDSYSRMPQNNSTSRGSVSMHLWEQEKHFIQISIRWVVTIRKSLMWYAVDFTSVPVW